MLCTSCFLLFCKVIIEERFMNKYQNCTLSFKIKNWIIILLFFCFSFPCMVLFAPHLIKMLLRNLLNITRVRYKGKENPRKTGKSDGWFDFYFLFFFGFRDARIFIGFCYTFSKDRGVDGGFGGKFPHHIKFLLLHHGRSLLCK